MFVVKHTIEAAKYITRIIINIHDIVYVHTSLNPPPICFMYMIFVYAKFYVQIFEAKSGSYTRSFVIVSRTTGVFFFFCGRQI